MAICDIMPPRHNEYRWVCFFYLAKDFNEKNGDLTMARAIQIRRGTAQQHADFTGKIGEVTMDTTNNTLRIHDGTTVGGTVLAKISDIPDVPDPFVMPDNYDFVISFQKPTSSNGYKWYRKYKSGWVEQGGRWTGSKTIAVGYAEYISITLPVKMANAHYTALTSGGFEFCIPLGYKSKTVSSLSFTFGAYSSTQRTLTEFTWYVAGLAA